MSYTSFTQALGTPVLDNECVSPSGLAHGTGKLRGLSTRAPSQSGSEGSLQALSVDFVYYISCGVCLMSMAVERLVALRAFMLLYQKPRDRGFHLFTWAPGYQCVFLWVGLVLGWFLFVCFGLGFLLGERTMVPWSFAIIAFPLNK